jgi:K+-sensing histidine kinase KdpD
METYYATPERDQPQAVQEQSFFVCNHELINGLLKATSTLLAVLNEHRQILAINESLLEHLSLPNAEEAMGMRLGEIICCKHAAEEAGGCGTSRACASCGAAIAMVTALTSDNPCERTCAITRMSSQGYDESIHFKVKTQPVIIDNQRLLLLFLQDSTEDQRRMMLERVFLHDLSNVAMAIYGYADMARMAKDQAEQAENINALNLLSAQLRDEITIQRCLARTTTPDSIETAHVLLTDCLRRLQGLVAKKQKASRVTIAFPELPVTGSLVTNVTLMLRVLQNMLLNAIEASKPGEQVKLRIDQDERSVTFHVWNKAAIDDKTAQRIFECNYSTKNGPGRGWGTYSMKYLGEYLLGGKVSFTSTPQNGTEFSLRLNRNLPDRL